MITNVTEVEFCFRYSGFVIYNDVLLKPPNIDTADENVQNCIPGIDDPGAMSDDGSLENHEQVILSPMLGVHFKRQSIVADGYRNPLNVIKTRIKDPEF